MQGLIQGGLEHVGSLDLLKVDPTHETTVLSSLQVPHLIKGNFVLQAGSPKSPYESSRAGF